MKQSPQKKKDRKKHCFLKKSFRKNINSTAGFQFWVKTAFRIYFTIVFNYY